MKFREPMPVADKRRPLPLWRRAHRGGGKYGRLVLGAATDLSQRIVLVAALNIALWPWVQVGTAWYRSITAKRQRLAVVIGSLGKTTTTRAVLAVLRGTVPDWTHRSDNCFSLLGWH